MSASKIIEDMRLDKALLVASQLPKSKNIFDVDLDSLTIESFEVNYEDLALLEITAEYLGMTPRDAFSLIVNHFNNQVLTLSPESTL
jgi:hypothetical protein